MTTNMMTGRFEFELLIMLSPKVMGDQGDRYDLHGFKFGRLNATDYRSAGQRDQSTL